MVFDISFNVEFLCDKFDSDKNSEKNVTLNLSVTEKDAENFLFKFTSPVFIFGDYKVLMKYDASFVVKNIVIFDNISEKGDYFTICCIHCGYHTLGFNI